MYKDKLFSFECCGWMATNSEPQLRRNSKKLQKLLVYGYLREGVDIPDAVKQICLSFYLILSDKWNKKISNWLWKIDNKTGDIIAIGNGNGVIRHAFGSLVITKGDIQTWIIKITNNAPNMVIIGIIEYKSDDQSFYQNMIYNAFCEMEWNTMHMDIDLIWLDMQCVQKVIINNMELIMQRMIFINDIGFDRKWR